MIFSSDSLNITYKESNKAVTNDLVLPVLLLINSSIALWFMMKEHDHSVLPHEGFTVPSHRTTPHTPTAFRFHVQSQTRIIVVFIFVLINENIITALKANICYVEILYFVAEILPVATKRY